MEDDIANICFENLDCEGVLLEEQKFKDLEMTETSRGTLKVFLRSLKTPDNSDVVPGEKAGDGSLLRPYIVFFGESVPMMDAAAYEAKDADIFVIIGTSMNVYPAAGLIQYTDPSIPVYLIDPEPVMGVNSYRKIVHIQKGASEGMKELVKILVK